MNTYKNIDLSKNLYKSSKGFTKTLEEIDPTSQYKGSELENLDAFERQLKRFDIKVSGESSDKLEKFFMGGSSQTLFPEYVSRAVKQGMVQNNILDNVVASTTNINSMDYRTISTDCSVTNREFGVMEQGGKIPVTNIKLKESLVSLIKRGRMLVASYESVKYQHLDLFTVALKEIGSYISKSQLKDAVEVLINGDGNKNPAEKIKTKEDGKITYDDLISLWSKFDEYEMNTMLVSPDVMVKLLSITEFKDAKTGLNFQATGKLTTPLGATLIKSNAVPKGTIVGLDNRFALERVCVGGVNVDYDKLIDCQLERAAITSVAGFSKIVPDAVKVMTC